MTEKSLKGSLPHGWSGHVSRKYPGKIYYFNSFTGDTTWECPKLNLPKSTPGNDSKAADMGHKSKKKSSTTVNKSVEECSESRDETHKSVIPPTAVVTPMVQKRKKQKPDDRKLPCAKQMAKLKQRSNSPTDNSNAAESCESVISGKKRKYLSLLDETDASCEKFSYKKERKYISPLNNPNLKEILSQENDDMEATSLEISEDENNKEACPNTSTHENTLEDVEMLDVSIILMEDLNEMKDTEFDTTACYYIVVDTNVLISELDLISELKDTPLNGCGPPHIFIPWIVIDELDKLKNQKIQKPKVSTRACEAIRYLNSVLRNHPRFHGQSPAEAEKWSKTYSNCNDDKILECCLGLSDKMPPEKVILLTNDKNLVNKALICNIHVYNLETMIKKLKPDINFNNNEMKSVKKNQKLSIGKESEVPKVPSASQNTAEKIILQSRHNICKRAIHSIMSDARMLLKDVLYKFLSEEMFKAYGSIWESFSINTNLLRGLLEAMKRYWKTVFYAFFTEKEKMIVELLLEKVSRPEGFLGGDREECLVILSAVENIFLEIQKRQPNLNVPIQAIQEYRAACVHAFIGYSEAESILHSAEDKSVQTLLDDNWTAINEMCGIMMDYCKIPHDFHYRDSHKQYSDYEIRNLMVEVYVNVTKLRKTLSEILDALKRCLPLKPLIKKLAKSLLEFIPSLNLPYKQNSYPSFSISALERWFSCPQNRPTIEVGFLQIQKFFSKLKEAVDAMTRPST